MAAAFKELFAKGVSYERDQDIENAIRTYTSLIRDYPKFPLSYFNLAQLMERYTIGTIVFICAFYKIFNNLTENVSQLQEQRRIAQQRYTDLDNYLIYTREGDFLPNFTRDLQKVSYERVVQDVPFTPQDESQIRIDEDTPLVSDWSFTDRSGNALRIDLEAGTDRLHQSDPICTLTPNSYSSFLFKVNKVYKRGQFYNAMEFITKRVNTGIPDDGTYSSWILHFESGKNKIESANICINSNYYSDTEERLDFSKFYKKNGHNVVDILYNDYRGLLCLLNGTFMSSFAFQSGSHAREVMFKAIGMEASFYPSDE